MPERVKAGNWLLETFNDFQARKMTLTIDRTFALDYVQGLVRRSSGTVKIVQDFYELKEFVKKFNEFLRRRH